MRTVFIGASEISIETAKELVDKGHEVIIVETNKAKIDDLSEVLDCSFLHGDGSQPDILMEVNPKQTDILFCLADSDQANVIASLVGRSLGFKRVVTSIRNQQFETICHKLGLEDTIIPSRTISRHLKNMVDGNENADLSAVIKDEARLFMLIIREEDAGTGKALDLPGDARIICYYRDGKFSHADEKTKFQKDDQVVVLTHSKSIPELEKRWKPEPKDFPEEEKE